MLITDLIAQKRGPLAKVWLAACQERRLSKMQAMNVDVEESVDAILTRDVEPIALRLSGQLMLGVVRIYSRKVQYLFDDCKETRERITMAFRPGQVDLAEDQLVAPKAAITFTEDRMELEPLGWNFSAADFVPLGLHTADPSDITLPLGRYRGSSLFGGSSRAGSVDWDSASAMESQFDPTCLDLGLDLGDDDSVEYGRDAGVARSQRGASVMSNLRVRESSIISSKGGRGFDIELPRDTHRDTGAFAMDNDFTDGADLGLDLGEGFADDSFQMDMPEMEADLDEGRSRRESTRLSTPPPSPPASITDMTPRTAARVTSVASKAKKANAHPTKRIKVLGADEEIELQGNRSGARERDLSGILGKERYIPSNQTIIQLREVRDNPLAHFLPSVSSDAETYIYGAPLGFSSELDELFLFPSTVLRRGAAGEHSEAPAAKRARLEAAGVEGDDEEDDVEIGRRQSIAPASERDDLNSNADLGNFDGDFGGIDDYAFDLDPIDNSRLEGATEILAKDKALKAARARAESVRTERSRMGSVLSQRSRLTSVPGTPAPEQRPDYTLAMFDTRLRTAEGFESQLSSSATGSQSQSLSQSLAFLEDTAEQEAGVKPAGVSKNTSLALRVIRRELGVVQEDQVLPHTESRTASYNTVSQKASKRAASAFFFELLVLGTKDCVKLEQHKPFGDIDIAAKERLWDGVAAQ